MCLANRTASTNEATDQHPDASESTDTLFRGAKGHNGERADSSASGAAVPAQVGRFLWTQALLIACVSMSVGCAPLSLSTLKLPSMGLPKVGLPKALSLPSSLQEEPIGANYQPIGSGAAVQSATFTEEVYHKVREAKANNSIVLQILGDDAPVRVLPLPSSSASGSSDGTPKSVFVSTLVHQSGVLDKYGKIQAALFRDSPGNFEGIRMDVKFTKAGDQVRPESDYALRPGDRLVIRENDRFGLSNILDLALAR